MTRWAYYNENNGDAAEWLRCLIAEGHIAPGEVDARSIQDVSADDVRGFRQCHFFAGIGVWSYALRLAGWPDDRPVWTGSCPCQPFSAAGKRRGDADERHLWPVWFRLIRECGPASILGEQVSSKDALRWLDTVQDDLEGAGYAVGAADLCASGVGAPHIRQRLFWLAGHHGRAGRQGCEEFSGRGDRGDAHARGGSGRSGELDGMADSSRPRLEVERQQPARGECVPAERGGAVVGMGYAQDHDGRLAEGCYRRGVPEPVGAGEAGRTAPLDGLWADADWLRCTDGGWRPVEPGAQPLAHGVAGRVGLLRGYGNAIVAPLAAEFIRAADEAIRGVRL